MKPDKSIRIVGCHAEGEVGDVIIDGVKPPPGNTLWEQSRWIAEDGALRDFVLNEPRGGVFRHVNLLVPPKNPDADMGFIIMEPADTPPMSGSNSICVSTVLLETGIIPIREPITELTLEAPGGLVKVRASCSNRRVDTITVHNVPSFVGELDATIELNEIGSLQVDTAYGGDSFVIVDAAKFGFLHSPDEARDMAELGVKISDAATEQLGFHHPENPDWAHISFCLFASPVREEGARLITDHAVAIRPGKIDRSPTGTAVSARLAVLHAKGQVGIGAELIAKSIIGSTFVGKIEEETSCGSRRAIIPSITGRAWLTGKRELLLDPRDPWPNGYRISDTWPNVGR